MNANAYQRLGELLLDELLLRAGLAQTDTEPVHVSLDAVVGVDTDRRHVVLKCKRINSPPIELHLPLPEP